MKVLLITGTLAADEIKKHAAESKTNFEISIVNVPVAAFLTPETIISALRNAVLNGFDMILVPGLMRGNTEVIAKATKIPTFKGPRYAADLPIVLELLGEVKLSTTIPACDLLREKLEQKALQELAKVEQRKDTLLKKPGNITIKNLAVGNDFPMRVLAEIVDAALMPNEQVQQLAMRFVRFGADIIDLGMVAGENRPSDAKRVVTAVREVVNVPVSIDTLNPKEIQEAVKAGADLVLSVDAGNIEQVAPFVRNATVVVIPTNQQKGFFPKGSSERVAFLEEIVEKGQELGVNKILGDLILEPSNIFESFVAFREFACRNPSIPLFVGVSNVTELIDADSVGVNALLARLAAEIGGSIMLATEKSDKAKGTVREEVIAAKMMFLAKKRGSVPKDLGVNMLFLKDKRNREEPYNRSIEDRIEVSNVIETQSNHVSDNSGSFRIFIDRQAEEIAALHYPSSSLTVPDKIIKGKTAEAIYTKIASSCLVSQLDHSAYLGAELAKAEVALKTGKEYIQDSPFFSKADGCF